MSIVNIKELLISSCLLHMQFCAMHWNFGHLFLACIPSDRFQQPRSLSSLLPPFPLWISKGHFLCFHFYFLANKQLQQKSITKTIIEKKNWAQQWFWSSAVNVLFQKCLHIHIYIFNVVKSHLLGIHFLLIIWSLEILLQKSCTYKVFKLS